MKPVSKMVWLIILIILASGIFFVILDDEDTKGQSLDGNPATCLSNGQ